MFGVPLEIVFLANVGGASIVRTNRFDSGKCGTACWRTSLFVKYAINTR